MEDMRECIRLAKSSRIADDKIISGSRSWIRKDLYEIVIWRLVLQN